MRVQVHQGGLTVHRNLRQAFPAKPMDSLPPLGGAAARAEVRRCWVIESNNMLHLLQACMLATRVTTID
jgi:hypothetical protein